MLGLSLKMGMNGSNTLARRFQIKAVILPAPTCLSVEPAKNLVVFGNILGRALNGPETLAGSSRLHPDKKRRDCARTDGCIFILKKIKPRHIDMFVGEYKGLTHYPTYKINSRNSNFFPPIPHPPTWMLFSLYTNRMLYREGACLHQIKLPSTGQN